MPPSPPPTASKQQIMDRARALAPRCAERAAAAEQARRIPEESVKDMLDAGFARILIPQDAGGYGLGFDTWFEVTRELCKADASHGWCASLIIHHDHLIAQYPQEAQKTLWSNGLDVPIAASFAPEQSPRRSTAAIASPEKARHSPAVSIIAPGSCLAAWRRKQPARSGSSSWSRPATTPSAIPGSPPACAAPAARPSSRRTPSCRTTGC